MSPRMRRYRTIAAWILLAASIVGWPLCGLWLAKDEPPVVLGLSFLAIIIECGSLLTASQVAEDQAASTT